MSKFLCVWNSYGIESVIDITEYEFEEEALLIEMIQTGQPAASKFGSILTGLMLRARFNPQRNYEIYAVQAVDSITDKDIVDMFNANPQSAANTIRKNGVKLFSDRQNTKPVIT